jgi:hypothetical protein
MSILREAVAAVVGVSLNLARQNSKALIYNNISVPPRRQTPPIHPETPPNTAEYRL